MNNIGLLFDFALIIGIMLVGMDIITRKAGFGANAQYRRVLSVTTRFLRRHTNRSIRWAWTRHKKFIFGAVAGSLATLYFTGRFG